MTGRQRPRPPARDSASSARPKGFDDVPELSAEEVERRVDVRGGAAPRGPVDRAVRTTRSPRPPERTAARDSLLLIGLIVVGLVAVRVLLPDGPLTASQTSAPTGTALAVGSQSPTATFAPITPAPPTLITLPPAETPSAAPSVPAIPEAPTAVPTPAPTARPGQTAAPTPRPTVKPSKSPSPTASPTAAPTAAPTATLRVVVSVVNGDGGTSKPSDWTVTVSSGGTATPPSFPGSASGTNVTITANRSYSVTAVGPPGYTNGSTGCSSSTGAAPGSSQTCTLVRNNIAPRVTVRTVVNGGTAAPVDWSVSVDATDAAPSSFNGNEAGVVVRFDAGKPYAITSEDPTGTGYTLADTPGCSGSGLPLDGSASCTFTYTYVPPPTDPPAGFVLPVLLAPWRRRRWPTTPTA